MNDLTKLFAATTVVIFGACVVAGKLPAASAPQAAQAPPNVSNLGQVDLTADSSTMAPNAVVYTNAHLIAQNGATLDADELRVNYSPDGKPQRAVATGHVRAHVSEPAQKQTYTVTADKGVFDPKANRIDMTGDVRAVVESPATIGPAIQTADTGVIDLGKAPEFPRLFMTGHLHAIFTPAQ